MQKKNLKSQLSSRHKSILTPNRPQRQTSFTCPKLNMDNFSGPGGPLGYGESPQELKGNSLHAQWGIRKGKGSGIIHILYIIHKNFNATEIFFVV